MQKEDLALRITIKSMLNVHTFDQFCWFGANANLHITILIEDNIFFIYEVYGYNARYCVINLPKNFIWILSNINFVL